MRTIDIQRLNHEREMMLEMAQREKKLEIQQLRASSQRRTIFVLSIAVTLLAGFIVLSFIYLRKKRRLCTSIVHHTQMTAGVLSPNREISTPDADVHESRCMVEGVPVETALQEKRGGLSPEIFKALYEEICRLMDTERLYADLKLTREALIERLGTNRTYFAQAISQNSGMNYAQFVNKYRIDEAVRILSDPLKKDYPLKQLSIDVGFGSLTTFYKTFKEATGISPSAFRKFSNSLINKRL